MPLPKTQRKLNELIRDLRGRSVKELRKKFKYKSKELVNNIGQLIIKHYGFRQINLLIEFKGAHSIIKHPKGYGK